MHGNNMIKKTTEVESGPAKFVLDGVVHSFRTFSALSWEALKIKISEEAERCAIARLSIYCAEQGDFVNYHEELASLFPSTPPAIEFLTQMPLNEACFVAISWGYEACSDSRSSPYCNTENWRIVSATVPNGVDNCHQSMQEALHHVEQKLGEHGFIYQDVVRTWIYVGGITHFSNGVEHYESINHSRKEYYDRVFGENAAVKYPASTGIGMDNRDIVITALAYRKRPFEDISPVENLAQTEAWHYPSHLAKVPPTFSRAYRISTPSGTLSLISGTASIIGAETVHIGDVQAQTEVTIDNLERVVASCVQQTGIVEPLSFVIHYVCYVKNPEDLETVRQVCNRRLPISANRIFVKADVCRDNLLVEIEAVTYEAQ